MRCSLASCLLLLAANVLTAAEPARPIELSRMLKLEATGADPAKIAFERLPVLAGNHALLSSGDEQWQFRLHNYLVHHDGRYWCFWSHGPVIEDQARQHLRYATSEDGLRWSEPRVLAGPPREGYGYIARGFWLREGKLLALASLYEAPAFHDGDLELVAFRWDAARGEWQPAGRVFDDALNNFEPEKLSTGEWIMSRRAADRSVSILIGGVRGIDQWQVIPFADYRLADGTALEEPHLWLLTDGTVVGMFRDNSGSGRIVRSISSDHGRNWAPPARTNFPDATSKFHGLRTSRGKYVLVSNPQPRRRNPLCLSVSDDGLVFRQMFRLPVPEVLEPAVERQRGRNYDTLQYPHVIEQGGALLVAYSRNKRTVELVRVTLDEIDRATMNLRQ